MRLKIAFHFIYRHLCRVAEALAEYALEITNNEEALLQTLEPVQEDVLREASAHKLLSKVASQRFLRGEGGSNR
jgi:hypothetical protein